MNQLLMGTCGTEKTVNSTPILMGMLHMIFMEDETNDWLIRSPEQRQ